VDKSNTVFAYDDNEHHMQLKMGLNNWEDIQVVDIKKVTDIPNVTNVYCADVELPEDLFAFEFVIQDYRTSKVRLRTLNDAPRVGWNQLCNGSSCAISFSPINITSNVVNIVHTVVLPMQGQETRGFFVLLCSASVWYL
jgi:hypothetical protein